MNNCFDIANKFINLSFRDSDIMTPMKLLKLTYIAHGYYLAFSDKPLFDNTIEAWKYGPVIPDLYHIIKRTDLSKSENNIINLYTTNNNLDADHDKFLEAVWKAYKKFDGGQLSSMTHEDGTPWHQVYNGESFKVIPNNLIKNYYKKIVNARK